MLCSSCGKLAYQHTQKKCMRCQGDAFNTISVLCENCSNTEKQCAACLKKVNNNVVHKHYYGGCGACRK